MLQGVYCLVVSFGVGVLEIWLELPCISGLILLYLSLYLGVDAGGYDCRVSDWGSCSLVCVEANTAVGCVAGLTQLREALLPKEGDVILLCIPQGSLHMVRRHVLYSYVRLHTFMQFAVPGCKNLYKASAVCCGEDCSSIVLGRIRAWPCCVVLRYVGLCCVCAPVDAAALCCAC